MTAKPVNRQSIDSLIRGMIDNTVIFDPDFFKGYVFEYASLSLEVRGYSPAKNPKMLYRIMLRKVREVYDTSLVMYGEGIRNVPLELPKVQFLHEKVEEEYREKYKNLEIFQNEDDIETQIMDQYRDWDDENM